VSAQINAITVLPQNGNNKRKGYKTHELTWKSLLICANVTEIYAFATATPTIQTTTGKMSPSRTPLRHQVATRKTCPSTAICTEILKLRALQAETAAAT
jgi:hypothetical protein